jgi:transposase
LGSIMGLLGLDLPVPDHTTFSRRSAGLSVSSVLKRAAGPVTVVIDSTGLKVFGAGEWQLEKHGGKPRRTWRKLHLAVDPDSGEILASDLTTTDDGDASLVGPLLEQVQAEISAVFADGAYDGNPVYQAVAAHSPGAAVIIPPRSTAIPSDTAEKGRLGWQKAVGYGTRSLVEVAMMRYKILIGCGLRARSLSAQKTEAAAGCRVLNVMTGLGMPVSRRVA